MTARQHRTLSGYSLPGYSLPGTNYHKPQISAPFSFILLVLIFIFILRLGMLKCIGFLVIIDHNSTMKWSLVS